MNINAIINTITTTLENAKLPANILPPMLIKYTSLMRSGLSAYKITANVIQNLKSLGIPTEENADGSMNLITAHDYALVKAIVDALKNDATIQVAIPDKSILIEAVGGNAGGPIFVTGTNKMDSLANGILQ